jgi:hypothetical protein
VIPGIVRGKRAREKLTEAEAEVASFQAAMVERKKKVDDLLNAENLAGFAAFLISPVTEEVS